MLSVKELLWRSRNKDKCRGNELLICESKTWLDPSVCVLKILIRNKDYEPLQKYITSINQNLFNIQTTHMRQKGSFVYKYQSKIIIYS